ncbi:MAG: DUF3362 domain-containing protein, partial [Desulfosporosinus sp.]|nr:DUF3362 domain-containing protein [Desulfosporosinus sp.]
ALIQYRNPKNYGLVEEALRSAHREDLIGYGPKCLIRPRNYVRDDQKDTGNKKAKKPTRRSGMKKKDAPGKELQGKDAVIKGTASKTSKDTSGKSDRFKKSVIAPLKGTAGKSERSKTVRSIESPQQGLSKKTDRQNEKRKQHQGTQKRK